MKEHTAYSLPKKISKRIEHNVLKACSHPAIHSPFHYSLDLPGTFVIVMIASMLGLLFWHGYVNQPVRAFAPATESQERMVEATKGTVPEIPTRLPASETKHKPQTSITMLLVS